MIETEPAIAVDKDNHVHIAWTGAYYNPEAPDNVAFDIFYSNIQGSFSMPIKINVPTDWYSRHPTIAVDRAGHAHIVFRRSTDQMNSGWYPGSRYFVLGDSTMMLFTFYDWVSSSDTDIFFLRGVWSATGIEDKLITKAPVKYRLYQNYPNPFNYATTIHYDIMESSHVDLEVYNTMGELMGTLVNEIQLPGSYKITLNANNFPSGIYLVSFKTKFCRIVKKISLIK